MPRMSPSLKQDLANLDKDPDTRRSAMDALKGYVEQLDAKSMVHFLDQVSHTKESEASRPYAISLFGEVARVHKSAILPFIPRIVSSVVNSLHSAVASQHLHQACAKVLALVARYTMDPTRSALQNAETLKVLCDPLLAVLSSKLEPVAVGAAVCLREIIESEKWKFASQDLASDLCYRAASALGHKSTQTVAHMQLISSLSKFNPDAIQGFCSLLLKFGLQVLQSTGEIGGTWQQRTAAVQLISNTLRAANAEMLDLDIRPISEALELYRTDRAPAVRVAVSEALCVLKSFVERKNDNSMVTPDYKPPGRRRRLWKTNEFDTVKNTSSSSQESQIVSYSPSPVSSAASLGTALITSPAVIGSAIQCKRSPLFPANQIHLKSISTPNHPSFMSDLDSLFSQFGSEMKENALATGFTSQLLSIECDFDRALLKGTDSSKCSNKFQEFAEEVGLNLSNNLALKMEHRNEADITTEDIILPGDVTETGTGLLGNHNSTSEISKAAHDSNSAYTLEQSDDFSESTLSCTVCNAEGRRETNESSVSHEDVEKIAYDQSQTSSQLHQLDESVNLQHAKAQMAIQDMFMFSSPRKLLHSLICGGSTPDSRRISEVPDSRRISEVIGEEKRDTNVDMLGESAWSVIDNPIASASDDMPEKLLINSDGNITFGDCTAESEEHADYEVRSCSGQLNKEGLDNCRQLILLNNDDGYVKKGLMETESRGRFASGGEFLLNMPGHTHFNGRGLLKWIFSTRQRDYSTWTRRLDKVHGFVEICLQFALCSVLVMLLAIAVIKCFNGQQEIHVLVPT